MLLLINDLKNVCCLLCCCSCCLVLFLSFYCYYCKLSSVKATITILQPELISLSSYNWTVKYITLFVSVFVGNECLHALTGGSTAKYSLRVVAKDLSGREREGHWGFFSVEDETSM